MLEKITIRNIATYDASGVEIKDLKKINFIYGANGCGKTTITRLVNDPQDSDFTDSFLTWKNGTVLKSLVYNKDFRDRNFGQGKIDGVFTLGQATKEEKELIETMKQELDQLKDKGIAVKGSRENLKKDKDKSEESFKEQVWNELYKKYENNFQEAFVGFKRKDLFKIKLLQEFSSNSSTLHSYDDLKNKSTTIFGQTPTSLDVIHLPDYERLLAIESEAVWQKKIIGKTDVDIAALIQTLNINDWVNEGRSYLQPGKQICPFCQQETISTAFREQLEEYFDEAFMEDTKKVKALYDEYIGLSDFIINALHQIENVQKTNKLSKLKMDLFIASSKAISSLISENLAHFQGKIKEPSRITNITSTKEQIEILAQLISDANQEIENHNKIVNDFSNQRNNLIKEIWKFLIEDHRSSIEAYIKKDDGQNLGVEKLRIQHEELRTQYTELNDKIKEANKNVTSVQPSVD